MTSASHRRPGRIPALARRIVFSLLLLVAGLTLAQTFAASPGQWSPTGTLEDGRSGQVAAALSDGKVLVTSGSDEVGVTLTTEIYDPNLGTWSFTGRPNFPRVFTTATLLRTGKVLVAGGYSPTTGSVATAELYDSVSRTWSYTGNLNTPRRDHSATLLNNGKVLIVGGDNDALPDLATAELYDPATGNWTQTGSMSTARRFHTATLLADGRVLVAAGEAPNFALLDTAEIYNPATGIWTPTGSLRTGKREFHSATLLPSGKVLLAGGYNPSTTGSLTSSELYDPAAGTWTATGNLHTSRYQHTAAKLANAKVLVAAGAHDVETATAELYDPATGIWTTTGSLFLARTRHTMTLLPDGDVLVAGGTGVNNGTQFNSCEVYASGIAETTQVTGSGSIAGQGDSATFNFHATLSGGSANGSLTFSDPAATVSLRGAKVRTLNFSGTSATFGGIARLGDGSKITYSVSVSDNGADGSTDTFAITLSNGYTAGGTLTSGDIKIQ